MFTSRQQFTIEQTQVTAYAKHLSALMDFSAGEEWHFGHRKKSYFCSLQSNTIIKRCMCIKKTYKLMYLHPILSFQLCLLQEKQQTTPQTVEVHLCCLRATRDKLPRGLYMVSMSLHSHMGGLAVAPLSERSQHQWSVSTQPVEHLGRYYSTDLNINQSLMMVRTFLNKAPAAVSLWYSWNSVVYPSVYLPVHPSILTGVKRALKQWLLEQNMKALK